MLAFNNVKYNNSVEKIIKKIHLGAAKLDNSSFYEKCRAQMKHKKCKSVKHFTQRFGSRESYAIMNNEQMLHEIFFVRQCRPSRCPHETSISKFSWILVIVHRTPKPVINK